MEIQLRHQPSFSVARALLGPGEAIRAESGAMMAMAPDTQVEAKAEGGMLKSLKRAALGGESFFVTTLAAGPGGGWVDVAANLPGDLAVIEVTPDRPAFIQKGSFLICEMGVQLETQWGGMQTFAGGEGGFLVRAEGQGTVVVSCYGALDRMLLEPGQSVTVDSGHMVAYQAGVQMGIRKVTGGIVQSMKSGEGLVLDFTGPGEVMVQSRNPKGLISWLTANGLGTRA